MMEGINLWLDDVRDPSEVAPFMQPYRGMPLMQWWWVKTMPAAIKAIQEVGIDKIGLMGLDHDLGLCERCMTLGRDPRVISYGDPISYPTCVHNGDGTMFVTWMRDNNIWPARRPLVHSFNPDGRRRMEAMIEEHYQGVTR